MGWVPGTETSYILKGGINMKRIIIEYYCDLCEEGIISTSQDELPHVTVQAVRETTTMTADKEKQTYIRNMAIHVCEECLETYMNRLPLEYDEGNNRPVWKGNHR